MRVSATTAVVAVSASIFATYAAPAILPPSTNVDFGNLVDKREASLQGIKRLEHALGVPLSSINLNSLSGPGNIDVIGRRPHPNNREAPGINIKREASPQRGGYCCRIGKVVEGISDGAGLISDGLLIKDTINPSQKIQEHIVFSNDQLEYIVREIVKRQITPAYSLDFFEAFLPG